MERNLERALGLPEGAELLAEPPRERRLSSVEKSIIMATDTPPTLKPETPLSLWRSRLEKIIQAEEAQSNEKEKDRPFNAGN